MNKEKLEQALKDKGVDTHTINAVLGALYSLATFHEDRRNPDELVDEFLRSAWDDLAE